MKRRNFINDVVLTSLLLACNKRNIPGENSLQASVTNDLLVNTVMPRQ